MERKDFLAVGFNEYPAGPEKKWANCLLQKKVADEDGDCKYFINVYPSTVTPGPEKFTTKVQFYRGADTINFELHPAEHHTPEFIEKVVEDLWKVNEMDIDHHN